jgi:Transposase, Mutator family
MASLRMTLLDLLNKSEQGADPNFLRDGVQLLAQELMDPEVTDLVGAEPHQRAAGRTTYRNGNREREWDTRVGTLELQIPSSAKVPTSRACSSLAAGELTFYRVAAAVLLAAIASALGGGINGVAVGDQVRNYRFANSSAMADGKYALVGDSDGLF